MFSRAETVVGCTHGAGHGSGGTGDDVGSAEEMLVARPTWRGAISFGLVNVPVQLFTAVRPHSLRFRQLHRETHAPVRQKRVDESTGEEVAYRDIVKGYEVGTEGFVVVDPEELSSLDPEASRLIDILDYVDAAEIDPLYYDRAYYLAPDGEVATKPYRLLAEAMARAQRVAIATLVMRNRAYLAAVRSRDGLLVLSTMHYADEVLEPGELGLDLELDVKVSDREVAMAEQLIGSLSTTFEPSRYHDTYHQRVVEFLEAKAEGEQITIAPAERDTGKVVDLMAALEQSLARAERERSGAGTSPPRGPAGAGSVAASPRSAGETSHDYETMTRDELYALAREREVPGRSGLSKQELIAALSEGDQAAGAA